VTPLHGPLHTLAGASLLALATVAPSRYGLTAAYAALARRLRGDGRGERWLRGELGPVSRTAAAAGALVGGVSHVLLDALVHPDVLPLAPWRQGNALWVPGAFAWTHTASVVLGVAGLLAWVGRGRGGGAPSA